MFTINRKYNEPKDNLRKKIAVWKSVLLFVCLFCVLVLPTHISDTATAEASYLIDDFDGPQALQHWRFSNGPEFPGASGALSLGTGLSGKGAVLEYRFRYENGIRYGRYVAASWKPVAPLDVRPKAALSLWICTIPDTDVFIRIKDETGQTLQYLVNVLTLEHDETSAWRRIVLPLAVKPAQHWGGLNNGHLNGRIVSIEILAQTRYPQTIQGNLIFDDVWLLESADQVFRLNYSAPLIPTPAGGSQLKPRLGVKINLANLIINDRFVKNDRVLDSARGAGFSFVRMHLFWSQVEKNGQYDFAAYDALLDDLDARGMGALWILAYRHPDHDGGAAPRTNEEIAAFTRFAEAAAAHFKGRNVRYEIWNEPNLNGFWKPLANTADYALLLREATSAIRRADASAQVCSGGLAGIDVPFLSPVLEAGAARDVYAIGIHPYRKAGPETLMPDLVTLRKLVTNKLGTDVQIWDTEWGYPSYGYFAKKVYGDGHSEAAQKRQAVLTARRVLTAWALNLPVTVLYDLRDDGGNPVNREHNFGLLNQNYSDKPAMKAVRTLTHIAANRTYAGLLRDVPHGMHAMRLDGHADTVFVVWNDQPGARLTLQFSTQDFVSATNMLGEPVGFTKVDTENAAITLDEADGPVYLCWKHE